jgi:hypothetical protein
MIKNIIDLLQVVNGETENIRIAQGKNALPKTLKGSARLIKKQVRNGSKGI